MLLALPHVRVNYLDCLFCPSSALCRMSEDEQSDKADLGTSSLDKTHFHLQYTPYRYITLVGEKNKIPPFPTQECPCCGICQESTWSLCTSQGLCQPELKDSNDYTWHFQDQFNHKLVCYLKQQIYAFCQHNSISLIELQEILVCARQYMLY